MINLYEETVQELEDNCKFTLDVLFVKCYSVPRKIWLVGSWADFSMLARNIEVNMHCHTSTSQFIYVVGDDWWLERMHDDDCHEWWEFNSYPTRPSERELLTENALRGYRK